MVNLYVYRRTTAAASFAMLVTVLLAASGCGNVADKYQRHLAQQPGGEVPTPSPNPPAGLEAKLFSPSFARVGLEMELDASGTTGGSGEGRTYQWRIVTAPLDSVAEIQAPASVVARFVPDAEGEYEFELVVTESGDSSSERAKTSVLPPASFVSRVQTGLVEWTDFMTNTVEVIELEYPVDLSRSLFMMTVRAERTNPRYSRYSPKYQFLDNQTIELRTGATPNDPLFVAWTVVEFLPEAAIAVQRGSVDRSTSEDGQLNIALDQPVDPSRAFVVPLHHQSGTNFSYAIPNSYTATLSEDGSFVRLRSNGNPDPEATVSQWQVIEFTADSGVQVSLYELDISPSETDQAFLIEPISPRDTFIMSAGSNIATTSTQFPARQAFRAFLADGETLIVRKNAAGIEPSVYAVALYVVSVAGARVQPFEGVLGPDEAVPADPPRWESFDLDRFDPVVMTGWNAFQFVYGSGSDTTRHAVNLYTVELTPGTDGVNVERGLANSEPAREFSGFVVGWPKH